MSRVRFGDVAREVRKSCREVSGLRVVGLEHLEPENVTLEQWSESNDNTFSKLFSKGQVLFGRRRAYLKKAALATFDGVCSGDITVIEAIPDALEADLLPFIVQNDAFFDFAVGGSAGSLSPRVKWEHLSQYEFELPTFEEQKKLAQVLWAMERTKRAYKELLKQSADLAKSQFVEMFGDPITNDKGFPVVKLKDVAQLITKGASPKWQGYSYTNDSSQTLFVTSENVREGFLDLSEKKYLEDGFNDKQRRSMLKNGDFLINIVGASIGRAALYNLDVKANINQAVALVRMKNGVVADKYMLSYLNSPKALLMYDGMKSSVARANLSLADIAGMELLLPPVPLQNDYAAFIEQLDKSAFALKETLAKLTAAQKALMNQVFEK